jgi:hypothetical protein
MDSGILLIINPTYEYDIYIQILFRIWRLSSKIRKLTWILFILLNTNDENALFSCIEKEKSFLNDYFKYNSIDIKYLQYKLKEFECLINDSNFGEQFEIEGTLVNKILYKEFFKKV